ncbi:MAG TPA: flagellar filament capping protein FliD [Candidatus Hydrogenedentes bacterium]|nr:flagellar filament capping protein FliD [Candidatus Hydrogenedentota bacterium]
MAGGFSVGGLITGLDTGNIIAQLMRLERQPIVRLETRISALESEQSALRDLRTTLQTLRNRAQDYRFSDVFSQFNATSSEETVLTAEVTGANPAAGTYEVNVTQLASATVAESSGVLGSAINPAAALDSSGITTDVVAGDFTVNGVTFTVDPTTDTLNGILGQINASAAGVTATYDAVSDKVTFVNSTPGDTSLINFGAADDDSNFLEVLNVADATQSTGGGGSTEVPSTRNLGAVDPGETLNLSNFAGGAMTSGSFMINGITITVDVANDSLADILGQINDSDAQVTASYDATSDTIRIVSDTLGSRTVKFTAGTSNFLAITNLDTAVQTAGKDSQFTINGGAVKTRNTNEVADAIGGVTLEFLSLGTSTVAVSSDNDAIVEDVQEFIAAFNGAVDSVRGLVGPGGALENDGSIRMIESTLRSRIFSAVTGIGGTYSNLLEIGITTGDDFDATTVAHLELDEEEFLEALRDDRANIQDLFSNAGGTGIADIVFDYVDSVTATTGFLHDRAKANGTIDQLIQGINDRIERIEARLVQREQRLRQQFTRLEQLSASFQTQGTTLSSLISGYSFF